MTDDRARPPRPLVLPALLAASLVALVLAALALSTSGAEHGHGRETTHGDAAMQGETDPGAGGGVG